MENERYSLGTLEKGLRILDLLERANRPLRIQDIVESSGMERGGVFRIVSTLAAAGYIERLKDKRYHVIFRRRRIRLGYSAPLSGSPFRRDVTLSIQRAAASASLELLMLNCGEDNPGEHIANAQMLIDAKVDLIIVFLTLDLSTHVLADRFVTAGLPVIAVETPIPGAVFFGGNNFRAGFMAGNALGAYARDHWNRQFDRLVLVESSLAAPATQARLSGAVAGVREILPDFPESRIIHLDGLAHSESSCAAVDKLLKSLPPRSQLLISAFNDPSAIGALEAVRAASREETVVVVGQNATAESRAEISKPRSPLIASVAYFPERYGDRLVTLAMSILNREQTPLAVYTEHVLLDAHNISRFYPRDLAEAPIEDLPVSGVNHSRPATKKGVIDRPPT
jgi:ribose transport system substrate-binding protein